MRGSSIVDWAGLSQNLIDFGPVYVVMTMDANEVITLKGLHAGTVQNQKATNYGFGSISRYLPPFAAEIL